VYYLALHYDVTVHVDVETRDISEVQKLKGRNIFSKMLEVISLYLHKFVVPSCRVAVNCWLMMYLYC
jgi:hypothetical protein